MSVKRRGKLRRGEIVVEWGGDPSTRRTVKRIPKPRPPLTPGELWEACRKYLPPELRDAAGAGLLDLVNKAEAATAKAVKRKPGRPQGGVGAEVAALMRGPIPLDQRMARSAVAGRLWREQIDKRNLRPVVRAGEANFEEINRLFTEIYEQVARLHQKWKREQTP